MHMYVRALQLYMWDYTRPRASPVVAGSFGGGGGGGQPHVALKTRRSLRAVHFHPHGRPLMLTAEVNLCLFMSGGCCWWFCRCLQCRSIVIMAAHTDKREQCVESYRVQQLDDQEARHRHLAVTLQHTSRTVAACATAGGCRRPQQLDTGGPATATHHSRCARGAACQASAGRPVCAGSTREFVKQLMLRKGLMLQPFVTGLKCILLYAQPYRVVSIAFISHVVCSCQACHKPSRRLSNERHNLLHHSSRQPAPPRTACIP